MLRIKKRILRLSGIAAIAVVAIGLTAFQLDYFEINKQLNIFTNLFKEVNLHYVDETNPAELMDDAIGEMLNNLDPYTVYIPEEDVEDFRISQTGQYGGIGATIRTIGDYMAIDMPYKGFAADKAGLIAGDLIISIDGKDMKGASAEDVTNLLKGSPGTSVQMTIRRYGEDQSIEFKREEIKVSPVPYYGMLNETTGYITLKSFTETASSDVGAAIRELRREHGMKSLIFDLQGNPGGLLREAIHVSNLFIPKGQLVVSTKGRARELDEEYRTLLSPILEDMPVAILIDQGSASASEIVAGTIQDLDRGVVIGQRSFGKGLVQQSRQLSYGAQMKITIAKYYTPSGRCIQAIDYAERRNGDGELYRLPDSLRTAYTTAAGRTVYDGGGIDPDITVEREKFNPVVYSLAINGHLFEYATRYVQTHPSIADPAEFNLSDVEYTDFINFLNGKEYHYETETEYAINVLKKKAEKEEYSKALSGEIERLEQAYTDQKEDDLIVFKDQIRKYLEREIVGRYYYEAGQIEYMLRFNPHINTALKILNDNVTYASILSPES